MKKLLKILLYSICSILVLIILVVLITVLWISISGNPEFKAAGELAQRKSIILLKNDPAENGKVLPLKQGLKIFIKNVDPVKAGKYGTVVKNPEQADFAIMRINAPSEHLKGSGLMALFIRGGDLDMRFLTWYLVNLIPRESFLLKCLPRWTR